MKKQSLLLVSALVLLLSGCSSPANDPEKAAAMVQEKNEAYLESLPEWVLVPPIADSEGFYAVGIGQSNKLTVSLDKATLKAEFNLAKAYKQELSANEKSFTQDDYEQYTQVIDNFIGQVDMSGYELVKRKVEASGSKYNTYVLVKMPYERFNRSMMKEIGEKHDAKAAEAFKELQARIAASNKAN